MATPEQLQQLHEFTPVVKKIAGGFRRHLPCTIEYDDLIAAGMRGLWDALGRARSEQGLAFEYYVRVRIRGSILDELRAQDWLGRRARERAEALGEPATTVVRFDELDDWTGWDEDKSIGDADEAIARERLHERVAGALFKLPPRERHVICEYYVNGQRMRDIADRMGVSHPRVSQLHARALNRLQAFLTGQRVPLAKTRRPRATTECDSQKRLMCEQSTGNS